MGVSIDSRWQRVREQIVWRAPSSDPFSLAVFRVVVALFALQLGRNVYSARHWELPRELWAPPVGTEWAADLLPVASVFTPLVIAVYLLASFALLLGLRPSLFAGVAAVAGVYVGWLPTLSGKVNHYHHIIWFLALLAFAPAADRLSISRRRVDRTPVAYAAISYAVVLVIGLIYFGAGLRKIVSAGFEWALSDNLQNIIFNLSWEKGLDPPAWVLEMPWLVQALALGALLFELGFIVLVVRPEARRWARWLGPVFHLSTFFLLGIGFWSLQACYVAFFDWSRLDRGKPSEALEDAPSGTRSMVAGSVLTLAVALAALTFPVQAWPLAAYPGFSGIAQAEYVDFELVTESGSVYLTDSAVARRFGAESIRPLLGAAIRDGDAALEAFVAVASYAEGAPVIRIDAVRRSTVPGAEGEIRRTIMWSDGGT